MAQCSVLVVDDDPAIRCCIREILEEEGYSIAEAPGCDQALRLLCDDGFRVVIIDIQMPGRSGLELAEEIERTWPGKKVIVMSGHQLPRPDQLKVGTAFLAKPFSPAWLRILVARAAQSAD
jgi:DNA-binding NtrC family response regulator